MKVGKLRYNSEEERYGIELAGEWYVDGLHCGQVLEILVDGEWKPARLEYNDNNEWYFVGYPNLRLYDLIVRY